MLEKLTPAAVHHTSIAGEPITAVLTTAPGNGASIGGLKVVTENGWFAARPSGTEDVYKIYAESLKSEGHLELIFQEARSVVKAAACDGGGVMSYILTINGGSSSIKFAVFEIFSAGGAKNPPTLTLPLRPAVSSTRGREKRGRR